MKPTKACFITAHLTSVIPRQLDLSHYVTIRAHEDAVSVLIRGEGAAACCCAHLLTREGVPLIVETASRPKVPVIMLGEATQRLLADVFHRDDLFEGLPRIHKRVVSWGKNAGALALPHSAVVASEEGLLARILSTTVVIQILSATMPFLTGVLIGSS